MAKARPIPGLTAEEAYATAAAKIVAVRAREVADPAQGVLDVSDIEHVHDMRVATRRLRAALEVFEPCFPRMEFKAVLAEVKAIADALGERRDRDVSIIALERFGGALEAPDRHGVAALIDELRGEQSLANERLVPFVDKRRLTDLRDRIDELVAIADERAA